MDSSISISRRGRGEARSESLKTDFVRISRELEERLPAGESSRDFCDAMIHGRVDVKPVCLDDALAEIQIGKGHQFDPELSEAFCAFVRQLAATHPNLQAYPEETGRHTVLVETLGGLRDLITVGPLGAAAVVDAHGI